MLSLLYATRCYSFVTSIFSSKVNIKNFVIIGTIINLLVLGGVVEVTIPGVVNGPCAWNPLSHLIVILDWGIWALSLPHPVHNVFVIGGVIDTLWPSLSPVSSLHQVLLWNSLELHCLASSS